MLNIIIVEDSESDVHLIEEALRSSGVKFRAVSVSNEADFRRALAGPRADVILSDCLMPLFSCEAALKVRSEIAPGVPLIVVTGCLGDSVVAEYLKLGADDYIIKDRLARLPQAIAQAISRKKEAAARVCDKKNFEETFSLYRDILDDSFDIISLSEMDGRLVYVNRAFREKLGYGGPGDGTPRVYDLFSPGQRAKMKGIAKRILGGEARFRVDTELLASDGRLIPVKGSVSAHWAEGRPPLVKGVYHDIAEEQELRAQLVQSQKMEALGTFAAGIAHDFNNILGLIDGYLEMLAKAPGDAAARKADIGEMQDAVLRGAALSKQLLAFGCNKAFVKEPLNLRQFLGEISGLVKRITGGTILVEASAADGALRIMGERNRLGQVFLNLASNARDAMPEGGKLSIEAEAWSCGGESDRCPVPLKPGAYARITVRDTGRGIPPEALPKVFDPFFTTKPAGSGTGLGLSTAYSIVAQHGGSITVESVPGRGTTFTLYLPLA